MTIVTHTFDRMRITPGDDAMIYSGMLNQIASFNGYNRPVYGTNQKAPGRITPGYKDMMHVTISGSNVVVATGSAMVFGRSIEVITPEIIPIPSTATGTVPLCIRIDLTQQNTSSGTPGSDDYVAVNNQVTIGLVTGTKNSEPLDNGGHLFDWEFARITNAGTSSVGVVQNSSGIVANVDLINGWKVRPGWPKMKIIYNGFMATVYGDLTSPAVAIGAGSIIGNFPIEFAPIQSQDSVLGGNFRMEFSVRPSSDETQGQLSLQGVFHNGAQGGLANNSVTPVQGISWIPRCSLDPNWNGNKINWNINKA